MFILKEIHFDGKDDLSINISDELGENLIVSMKKIGTNMVCHYLFQIVKRNFDELIMYMQSQQNKLDKIDAIESNRLLYNFLDTFYAYINYYESNYKNFFKSIKKEIYDNNFEYRFIYNLRRYVIHENLAILRISKQIWEDHIDVKFEIDNTVLSKSTSCQKKFKEELKNRQEQYTDLYKLLRNFYNLLLKIHIQMLSETWKELRKNFTLLMDNIPNKQDVFLMKNNKIINSLLNVANKYYKCVLEYFVYAENLLQDENVNKFYCDISFLYYKQKNCFYVGNE